MLDIGIFELLLIGIVALLVLGPEKMPSAIRTTVLWIGRIKRSFNKVKSEIEQQIDADDIRRQLHNESILSDIEKAKKNANKLIQDTQSEIDETKDQVKRNVDDIKKMPTVTNSAEEGIPTGEETTTPPAESTLATNTGEAEKTDAASTVNASQAENTAQTPDSEETPDAVDTADTTTVQRDETDSTEDTTDTAKKAKPVVEDFYNTPPEGIVSIHGGNVVGKKQESDDSDDSDGSAKS